MFLTIFLHIITYKPHFAKYKLDLSCSAAFFFLHVPKIWVWSVFLRNDFSSISNFLWQTVYTLHESTLHCLWSVSLDRVWFTHSHLFTLINEWFLNCSNGWFPKEKVERIQSTICSPWLNVFGPGLLDHVKPISFLVRGYRL